MSLLNIAGSFSFMLRCPGIGQTSAQANQHPYGIV
nr:MAG TPA: hypothetical protein [Caudoviricetes sp.]